MDPISGIIRTEILRPDGSLQGKGGLAGLAVGDVVTAFVLAGTEDGEVVLSLKGEKIPARTETTLFPGDRISLRVEDLAGTIVLRLVEIDVPEARQIADLMRSRLPQAMNVGGDYSDLRAVLGHLLKESPALRKGPIGALFTRLEQIWPEEGAPADKLKAFVESSGIFYERQSAAAAVSGEVKRGPASDLKALLLEAQATARAALELNPALRGELDKLLEISERVLKNTEVVQLANSLMNRSEGVFWTVFPYGKGAQADSVDWEVRQGNGEAESEGISFSLTFNLSGMGKVKVDGLFSGNRLHCHFWGQDEETACFIDEHLKEFSHSAENIGMIVGSLVSGVAQGMEETTLQKIMKTSGIRLVDRHA